MIKKILNLSNPWITDSEFDNELWEVVTTILEKKEQSEKYFWNIFETIKQVISYLTEDYGRRYVDTLDKDSDSLLQKIVNEELNRIRYRLDKMIKFHGIWENVRICRDYPPIFLKIDYEKFYEYIEELQ